MAKKNFDAFINSAGKKPKPTPEEVEEMAKQLHAAATPTAVAPPPAPVIAATTAAKVEPPIAKQKSAPAKAPTSRKPSTTDRPPSTVVRPPSTVNRQAEAPKEKVRITIDLAKDLYKRMKLAVVENETEISAYIRLLIENDLAKK